MTYQVDNSNFKSFKAQGQLGLGSIICNNFGSTNCEYKYKL